MTAVLDKAPATVALPGLHAVGYLAHHKALLLQNTLLHLHHCTQSGSGVLRPALYALQSLT